MYCLRVLEVWSSRSRHWEAWSLWGLWGRVCFLPFSSFWRFANKLWCSLACRCIAPSLPSSSHGLLSSCVCVGVCVSSSPLFIMTQSYWISALSVTASQTSSKTLVHEINKQKSHMHRYQGLELPQMNFGGNNSTQPHLIYKLYQQSLIFYCNFGVILQCLRMIWSVLFSQDMRKRKGVGGEKRERERGREIVFKYF